MALFYKGVGVGTFLHPTDLRVSGISPRAPGALYDVNAAMQHIARVTTNSPCVSLTRSYGVAEMYAKYAGRAFPTAATPGYVYHIVINDPPPAGVDVRDPVSEVARINSNPLISPSYHHDGDMNFLLGVVDPTAMVVHLTAPIRHPPASTGTPRSANLSIELETLVRALRDAEVLVVGTIPAACVINRDHVY